jgi:hypothetical protein
LAVDSPEIFQNQGSVSYVGPETMLPITSVIAAIMGGIMIFGRTVWNFGRKVVRRVWPGTKPK